MSLYNGPPRGGTRGGKDQFSWENVKADKDREFYLGHSVKALTGRWQKGKDVYWYTREKDNGEGARATEIQAVKEREEELMAEALGLKPKKKKLPPPTKLNSQDIKKLLEGNPEEEAEAGITDPDAVKGLGYVPNMVRGAGDAEHEVMAGVGVGDPRQGVAGAGPAAPHGGLPPPPPLSASAMKKMLKQQSKEAKKAKKDAKKAKKKAKKEEKRAKKDSKKRKRLEAAAAQETTRATPKLDAEPDSSSSSPSTSDASSGGERQGAPPHEGPGRRELAQQLARHRRHDSPDASPAYRGPHGHGLDGSPLGGRAPEHRERDPGQRPIRRGDQDQRLGNHKHGRAAVDGEQEPARQDSPRGRTALRERTEGGSRGEGSERDRGRGKESWHRGDVGDDRRTRPERDERKRSRSREPRKEPRGGERSRSRERRTEKGGRERSRSRERPREREGRERTRYGERPRDWEGRAGRHHSRSASPSRYNGRDRGPDSQSDRRRRHDSPD
eukprot:jgi/Botrbrau1/22545/Bobra.114_2s0068.1